MKGLFGHMRRSVQKVCRDTYPVIADLRLERDALQSEVERLRTNGSRLQALVDKLRIGITRWECKCNNEPCGVPCDRCFILSFIEDPDKEGGG